MRGLIMGVGINDLPRGSVDSEVDKKWRNMLSRCYFKGNKGCYIGKLVCDEWLHLSKFNDWMINQVWQGLELDKDILRRDGFEGYCPENCAFVPKRVNNILTNVKFNGNSMLGVTEKKDQSRKKRFIARVRDGYGNSINLGYHSTQEEAHRAWQKAKASEIQDCVNWYATLGCFRTDVAEVLLAKSWKLLLDEAVGVETKQI